MLKRDAAKKTSSHVLGPVPQQPQGRRTQARGHLCHRGGIVGSGLGRIECEFGRMSLKVREGKREKERKSGQTCKSFASLSFCVSLFLGLRKGGCRTRIGRRCQELRSSHGRSVPFHGIAAAFPQKGVLICLCTTVCPCFETAPCVFPECICVSKPPAACFSR